MKVKLLLTFALLLTAVTGAWADDDSGSCGTVSYSYVESTHTLTISGTGAMADYENPSERPWDSYVEEIETIVIEDGVTTIGKYAFNYCSGLTTITIPASVTSIGDFAFYDCFGLTTVTIPASVTGIGEFAFNDCYSMTTITIPASVTTIGVEAFSYCSNIATMTVETGNKVYDSRNGCNAIIEKETNTLIAGCKNTIIPDDVTRIGDFAFQGCSGLTTITIPDGVTSIGNYAFSYCSNIATMTVEDGNTFYDSRNSCNAIIEKETKTLIAGCKNTKIPDDVTRIGDVAFAGCDGLTTVTIPAGVTYIGKDAFYDCTAVTDVYCYADPDALTWDEDCCDDFKSDGSTIIHVADADPWYTKFGSVVNGIFRDPSTVPFSWNYDAGTKTLTFSGTEAIPSYNDPGERPWIDYVSEVENIVINEGVRGIGNYAFSGCSGLTTITIPASVTSIGKFAFEACSDLTTVTIPASVTGIGNRAFEGCSGLTTVTIGSGVTYIGGDAFFNCTKVEIVYCNANPEELTWEENGCDDFKPDGTTIIQVADAAPWIAQFTDVVNGTFIDTPYVPFTWNYDAATKTLTFSGTMIPSYEDPDERPWIDYVSEVEKIVISDDVTRIGDFAFLGCSGLTTVTIPAGVTYIERDAFYDCTAVTDVYCNADPLKLTWDEAGCDDFKSDGSTIIHVADADPWYTKFGSVVNGIFRDPSTVPFSWNYDAGTKTLTFSGTEAMPSYYDLDKRPWIDYVEVVENIVINEGVRGIGSYAFYDCYSLTTVTIPASVTGIGYAAFARCSNLATMTVDAGNTKYDSRNGCNAIIEKETKTLIAGCKNTIIPDDVTNIDNYAFEGCISLTTVTIPAGVTSIGHRAFYGCSGLTTVTIGSGVTFIGYDAFYDCTNVTDVYCYANPEELTWDENGCDDFMEGKTTKCHVTDAASWSAMSTDVNVDFVGDLAPEAVTNPAGEEYWSSYYNSAAHLRADDNTTVYKATLSGTTVTLTEITDKVITAGQAVLLKKTTIDAVELTPCADASKDDYSGNDLEGVDAETAKESGSDYYVLSYMDSKLSFYKYSGTTLGANKAFFKIPANSSREFLDILGEVTGVDGRCKMEDGRSDVYYDLNGRRVMNPTKKGVYINNGKKVVIK